MSRQAKRQLIRMGVKNYNNLYKAMVKIAVSFTSVSLPLKTINATIDSAKLDPSKNIPELGTWIADYNNTIETLKTVCKDFLKSTGLNEVPLTILQDYIKGLKKGFVKSANK